MGKRKQRDYWLKYRGGGHTLWHRVSTSTKPNAIRKFLKGTTMTPKDVLHRKTSPPKKCKNIYDPRWGR